MPAFIPRVHGVYINVAGKEFPVRFIIESKTFSNGITWEYGKVARLTGIPFVHRLILKDGTVGEWAPPSQPAIVEIGSYHLTNFYWVIYADGYGPGIIPEMIPLQVVHYKSIT